MELTIIVVVGGIRKVVSSAPGVLEREEIDPGGGESQCREREEEEERP